MENVLLDINCGLEYKKSSNEFIEICGAKDKNITELTIPATIEGLEVKTISPKAFLNCRYLKSITFPESLNAIGEYAFNGCINIERVNINSIDSWLNIKFGNFYSNPLAYSTGCLYINNLEVSDLVIPNSVEVINPYAFLGCQSIEQVTIYSSLKAIGKSAFCGCKDLKTINIKSIEDWINVKKEECFDQKYRLCINDKELIELVIPEGIETISEYSFSYCSSIRSVDLCNSVKYILKGAFDYCNNLECVKIGSNVESFDKDSFKECPNLTKINVSSLDEWLKVSSFQYYNAQGYDLFINDKKVDELVIPETCKKIKEKSFFNITSIKLLKIPEIIEEIGDDAFTYCRNISSIIFYKSFRKKNSCKTQYNPFRGTNKLKLIDVPSIEDFFRLFPIIKNISLDRYNNLIDLYIDGKLTTDLIIPEGIKELPKFSFESLSIQSVKLPSSITKIPFGAFRYCTLLKKIEMPNVKKIDIEAFKCCYSLSIINLPGSLEEISGDAFKECTSLKSVVLPNKKIKILSDTFTSNPIFFCNGITFPFDFDDFKGHLYIRKNLNPETINDSRFIGFWDFINGIPTILKDMPLLNNELQDAKYKLKYKKCLSGCIEILGSTLKSPSKVKIPEEIDGVKVISIANKAFSNCKALKEVIMPNTIISIGNSAFENCTKLESLKLSNNLVSIGNFAFCDCHSLSSIDMPSSVKTIGKGAFNNKKYSYYDSYDVPNIKTVNISSLESWLNINFESETSNPLYTGGAKLFVNGELLEKDLVIPDGTEEIHSFAFFGYKFINSLTIPNSVKSIGKRVFNDCKNLSKINISSLESWLKVKIDADESYNSSPFPIADWFVNNEKITDVVIPDSTISLSPFAFCGWHSLKSVTIPHSLKRIGRNAFLYDCSLKVNISSLEDWLNIKFDNVISSPLYASESELFIDSKKATKYNIPNSIKALLPFAFNSCENLTSIIIPNSVTSIGEGAFSSCSSLTSIVIPESVTLIGDEAFSRCTSLTSIIIPNSVTSIGNEAFLFCSSLTSIVIPESVTFIGRETFFSCTSSIFYKGSLIPKTWDISWKACFHGTLYFYSETEPTDSGNYWHYDSDGVTPVIW